jgi:hypothetical protein
MENPPIPWDRVNNLLTTNMNTSQFKSVLSFILMIAFSIVALTCDNIIDQKLLVSLSVIFGLITYHNLSKLKSIKNE